MAKRNLPIGIEFYKTVIDEVISSNYDENSLKLSVASRDIPGNKIII